MYRIIVFKGDYSMHWQFVDITGKRFGKLVAVEYVGKRNHSSYWLCQCDCGNTKEIKQAYLHCGDVKSCRCSWSKRGKDNRYWNGYEDISGTYFKNVRQSAKLREIAFDITKEEIWNQYLKQGRKCFFSGQDIHFESSNTDILKQTASVDRLDSFSPYIKDNIVICHKHINNMKYKLSYERFLFLCDKISNSEYSPISEYENIPCEIRNESLNKIESNCADKFREFDIPKHRIWDLFLSQGKKCTLSNLDLDFDYDKKRKIYPTASLDRIDSKIGYNMQNVHWIHKDINFMKWQFDIDYFISICKMIHLYNKGLQ